MNIVQSNLDSINTASMKVTHNEASQAEPTRPFKDAEMLTGEPMGITIRSVLHPNAAAHECPVSAEVGLQIIQLLLDYSLESRATLQREVDELEARIASREALAAEKGGQQI